MASPHRSNWKFKLSAIHPLVLFPLLVSPCPSHAQYVEYVQPIPIMLTAPVPTEKADFGYSVSGIPDLNGDGYGDVVVGAWIEANVGAVYIFDGFTGDFLHRLTSPNLEFPGSYGQSVAGVPDVNGDGRGDVVIGAPGEGIPGEEFTGAVYIIDGASGTVLHRLGSRGINWGGPVDGISDINGDGLGDVLVGPDVFDGSTGEIIRTLTVESPYEGFTGRGHRTWSIPDLTDDGVEDILQLAAFSGTLESFHVGVVFDGSTGAQLRILQNQPPDGDPGVPDANGDGRGDVLTYTGERSETYGSLAHTYVQLRDGFTGSLLHTFHFSDRQPIGHEYQISAAGLRDVNGNGSGDVIVGAYDGHGSWDYDPYLPGQNVYDSINRANIYDGSTGELLQVLLSPHSQEGVQFGRAVAGIPDSNDSGRVAIVIGARYENPTGSPNHHRAGAAYLYQSPGPPSSNENWKLFE
jgi:FG-GAP repeat protein